MPFVSFLLGEGYGFSVLGNFVVAVNPDKFSVYLLTAEIWDTTDAILSKL